MHCMLTRDKMADSRIRLQSDIFPFDFNISQLVDCQLRIISDTIRSVRRHCGGTPNGWD